MKIHREGHKLLLGLIIVLGILGYLASAYVPAPFSYLIWFAELVIFLLVLQFFRSPVFEITKGENLVIAPADGKVVVIEETVEDEYLKDKRIQLSIFMSPLNVHVNRMPVSGNIPFFKYHPGKFLVAWHPKSSTENERTSMVVKTTSGVEIMVRQIAGAVARRIRWYVKEGSQLNQGDEFGFIKFGSRVDVFLPLGTEIKVKEGDVTKGGRTVLAELVQS